MTNIILCRYEYLTKDGKKWTNWFRTLVKINDNVSEEEIIKIKKDQTKQLDKITGLKHEFKIEKD